MLLDYIVWNIRPEIFSLPDDFPLIGGFSVRWYGLLFAMSFIFGYLIIQKMFKKEGIPIKVLDDLSTYMIISTIVGARLGHCLFYEPGIYLSDPIRILKIWEGGLASHGAAIGIIIALYYFSRQTKKPMLWVLDRIVLTVALAGFFIRMGNLMNSEIIGKITDVPWAFYFSNPYDPSVGMGPRHPSQLYESLSYLCIFIFLITYYYRRFEKLILGELFSFFLILVFGVRFFIEFLKEDQVGFEAGMSLNMGQLLSIPFVLIGAFTLIRQYRKAKLSTAK